jgi:RHS repeat-associated protein
MTNRAGYEIRRVGIRRPPAGKRCGFSDAFSEPGVHLSIYDGGVAGPGNITTQTGLGTYAYPAAGQPRPHGVTSVTGTFNGITNPSFSYDANGNMISRAGSTVGWSSYNYPETISASDVTGTEEVQFSYGPDRQRWKQIYTSPTPTETTYYVGGLIDVVFVNSTTNYRHYIYAGSEPVAVYSRTAAGVNTMSYMLEDHQGGVSAIASNSGAADVNESFSAFGTRRNPTTWSGAPSTTDLNTIASLSRQGYTFQTWLGQSMGLNHMNGRVQDAILGRFLSPDPHITSRSNAQSYNRYSYANNNPVSNTDPTGFDSCGLDEGDPCSVSIPDPGPPPQVNIPSSNSVLDSPGVGLTVCMGNCNYWGTSTNFYGQLPGDGALRNTGSGPANIGPATSSNEATSGSGLDLNYVAPATTAYGDPTQFDPTPAADQWLANNMPNALLQGSESAATSGFDPTASTAANLISSNTAISSGSSPSFATFFLSGLGGGAITGLGIGAFNGYFAAQLAAQEMISVEGAIVWAPYAGVDAFYGLTVSGTILGAAGGTLFGVGAFGLYMMSQVPLPPSGPGYGPPYGNFPPH